MSLKVQIRKKLDQYRMDISFEAERGCMGILGASGSGKSMALKCIAGIENPDEGYISLDGKVLYDSDAGINLKPQDRRVGYLFQNYALFPNMTVQENIAAGFGCKKIDQQAIEAIIYKCSLMGLEKKYPAYLSGGEQQRVALARMLIGRPDAILLDEPFSALDYYLREELQMELQQILKEFGGTSVMVTHDRDEVYKLSDTLYVIDGGRGIAHGETKALFKDPESEMTARLTGCKNITKAERLSAYEVKAPAWNMTLHLNENREPLAFETVYIGIRAHDFIHKRKIIEDANINKLEIEILEISEAPFEWNVVFVKKGETDREGKLYWKVSKELINEREKIEEIKELYIKQEGILLLHA